MTSLPLCSLFWLESKLSMKSLISHFVLMSQEEPEPDGTLFHSIFSSFFLSHYQQQLYWGNLPVIFRVLSLS